MKMEAEEELLHRLQVQGGAPKYYYVEIYLLLYKLL